MKFLKLTDNVIIDPENIVGFVTMHDNPGVIGHLEGERKNVRVVPVGGGAIWLCECKTEKAAQRKCLEFAKMVERARK